MTILDKQLSDFVQVNKRYLNDNEAFQLSSEPSKWFKPVLLPVPLNEFFPGLNATVHYGKKPIWFSINKVYGGLQ